MKIGIYPGSFDPITNGHLDILIRAQKIVDKLIIAVSSNFNKQPMFDVNERCEMIDIYLKHYNLSHQVEIVKFDNLLVDFAVSVKAKLIIRGLRVLSDFEYEFQMAGMNSQLNPAIETIFLPSSEKTQFISSRLVKEIASLGGDISKFVMPKIANRVYKYYQNI